MAGHKVSALDIPGNAAVVVLTGAGVSASLVSPPFETLVDCGSSTGWRTSPPTRDL